MGTHWSHGVRATFVGCLAISLRPVYEPEEFEPGSHRGWQHEASSRVDRQFRDGDLFSRLDDTAKARVTRLEPHLFRVLLLPPQFAPLLDLA